jgi:REP element-mobilizing transposase RayT
MRTGMTNAGLKTGAPKENNVSSSKSERRSSDRQSDELHTASSRSERRSSDRQSDELHTASSRSERRSSDRRLRKRLVLRKPLPHIDSPGLTQFVTFRLADAVPAKVIEDWREELFGQEKMPSSNPRHKTLQERIARYEDAGHGNCHLRDLRISGLVEQTLLHFHGTHYHCLAWCIMPNHVHVIIRTFSSHPLAKVIKSWKAWSARRINALLGQEGIFWARGYFDRFMRDQNHLIKTIRYIELNPVKAGLCKTPEEWPFSSARRQAGLDNAGLKTGVPKEHHVSVSRSERRSSDRRCVEAQ